MAELPGQVSPGSPGVTQEDSPTKKRKELEEENDSDDPDLQLDRMLGAKAQPQEVVPAWAQGLQNSCNALQLSFETSFKQVHECMGGFHTRLCSVEEQLAKPHHDPRVDGLEKKLDALAKVIEGNGSTTPVAQPSAPTHQGPIAITSHPWRNTSPAQASAPGPSSGFFDPWAGYRATTPQLSSHGLTTPDTDYSHLVVGGWKFDTPRKVITSDLQRLIGTFSAEVSNQVERSIVYGTRAQVAHIFLKPLEHDSASERFYAIQAEYSKKLVISSGEHAWISPSRTPARRLKNKTTRQAGETISCLWDAGQAPELEIGWQKQIIWLGDVRAAAANKSDLVAHRDHRIFARKFGDEADTQFWFNVSILAQISKRTDAEAEIKMQEFVPN